MSDENNLTPLEDGVLHETEQIEKTPVPTGPSRFLSAFEWVETIVLYFSVAMAILILLFTHSPVIGTSMAPTLDNGDVLIIRKLGYTAKQGDIIVCQSETYGLETPLVKRVIATEGQTVTINCEERTITVDGVVLSEDYIAETDIPFDGSDYLPDTFTVEKDKVFVMGDNRFQGKSLDSRYEQVGMIEERNVLGKVCVKIFPFKNFKFY